MKRRTFKTIYGNKATISVKVCDPPRAWKKIEPKDVVLITFSNPQYTSKKTELRMRPDEAMMLIRLLSEATEYYLDNVPLHQ